MKPNPTSTEAACTRGLIAILVMTVGLLAACTSEPAEIEAATAISPAVTYSTDTTTGPASDSSASLDDTVSVNADDLADSPEPPATTTTTPEGELRLATITDVEIRILEIYPPRVMADISGELPTPCHEVWSEVTEDGTTFDVSVWSVAPPPELACVAVIEPFMTVVSVGDRFEPGDYTLVVNGESYPFTI